MDAKGAVPPSKISRLWMVYCVGALLVLLLVVWPQKQVAPQQQQRGVTPLSNYRPATICAMPAKMADEVSNGSAKPTVRPNPNDHSLDRNLEEFTVVLTEGCFGDWVRVPRYWNSWKNEQFVSNDSGQYVGFWYFGWASSRGPFGPNNIPDWNAPPDAGDGRAKWRLQGRGVLRFIRTS